MSTRKEKDESSEGEYPIMEQPLQIGFWSGPGFINQQVQYIIRDGLAFVEGDICLGSAEEMKKSNDTAVLLAKEAQENVRYADAVSILTEPLRAGAIIGQQYRWPNCTLIYDIDPSLSSKPQSVTNLQQAIQHWTDKTGFKFKVRTTEHDYVHFIDNSSGTYWSYVGRRGGLQELNLSQGFPVGVAVHEIGHAIGYFHEQSRNDRDNYVRINWQYIGDGQSARNNFYQYLNSGQDIGPYDYCSIMHYSRMAFSIDGIHETITPLKPGAECMGQRTGLSPYDISAMKTMYPECVMDPCQRFKVAALNCLRRGNVWCYLVNIIAYFLCKYKQTKDERYLRLYRKYKALYSPIAEEPSIPLEEEALTVGMELPLEEEAELPLEEEAELPLEEEAELPLEEETSPPELLMTLCLPHLERAIYYLRQYRLKPSKLYLCRFYYYLKAFFCCLAKNNPKDPIFLALCRRYAELYKAKCI